MKRHVLRSVLFGASLLMAAPAAMAAVPSGDSARTHHTEKAGAYPSRVSLSMTQSALGLPLENRIQAILQQGPSGYRNLVEIMFNAKMPHDTRWRAVTAAGRIGGEMSEPELTRALQSSDWFMRNAGLVAMTNVNRGEAIAWARRLMSDKALIVRVAAVDTLADLNDQRSLPLLWEKLYSKENYKGKQSLFIRRRIVETLAKLEQPGNEKRFIEILGDKDEALHAPAIAALEKMTKIRFGTEKEPMKAKRAQWQKWWSERNQAQM